MNNADSRTQSEARFSRFAERYVASETHKTGSDLEQLLAAASPQPHWRALDIATGGGHTARTIAPYVAHMTAYDISHSMLQAAEAAMQAQNIRNVTYLCGDAEALALASESFDLVTCRIAPHHFPHADRFVDEVARILKPGGRFVLQDQVLPDNEKAARYVEAFERLRDPSHHRAYPEYAWRGMLLNSGLTVESTAVLRKSAKMIPWAQMQDCSPEVIEHLQILLLQAPKPVAEFMQVKCAGGPDAQFDHVYLLIVGVKPE